MVVDQRGGNQREREREMWGKRVCMKKKSPCTYCIIHGFNSGKNRNRRRLFDYYSLFFLFWLNDSKFYPSLDPSFSLYLYLFSISSALHFFPFFFLLQCDWLADKPIPSKITSIRFPSLTSSFRRRRSSRLLSLLLLFFFPFFCSSSFSSLAHHLLFLFFLLPIFLLLWFTFTKKILRDILLDPNNRFITRLFNPDDGNGKKMDWKKETEWICKLLLVPKTRCGTTCSSYVWMLPSFTVIIGLKIVLITTSQMVNFDSSIHFNVISRERRERERGKSKRNNFILILFPFLLFSIQFFEIILS